MKKLTAAIAVLFALLNFVASADAVSLTILHTNDTHSRMLPFDSKVHGPDSGGIVRRAGLIRAIKEEVGELLLLDAGDILQGTPFYSIFKGEACYRTASECGYDATTLGNHELDNDLANLQTRLAASKMRLLCCNVFYKDTGRHVFEPFHIFRRNGLKIAVIGSIGNEAWDDIDRKIRAPMTQKDQTSTVRETARRLRRYVDLVVVLSHAGIEFDRQMAAEVAEIDIIIGGHTHEELSTPILIKNGPEAGVTGNGLDGTIVAQAGEWGHFVGRIDLDVETGGRIASWSGSLVRVTADYEKLAPPGLSELVASFNLRLETEMNTVIGHTATDLSYPKDLRKTTLLPMGTFTAESMRAAAAADICVVNSGAIRTDIKSGDITRGEVFEALPYDNSVVTFTMTGKAVQAMLDHISAHPGEPDGYQYAGITGTLNFVKGKAENIQVAGQPLDPQREYRVSTSSFMANGNIAGDLLFPQVLKVEDSGILMREAAIAMLEKVKELPDMSQPPMKLIDR